MRVELIRHIIADLKNAADGVDGFDVASADFHALDSWQVGRVTAWASAYGYRKPRNANGSTGRYFFQLLARQAQRDNRAE